MKPNNKIRQSDIISELHRTRDSHQVTMFIELLGFMLEEEKHTLVSSTGDDTLRTQGKAMAVGQLLTMLTRAIVPIKALEQTGDKS